MMPTNTNMLSYGLALLALTLLVGCPQPRNGSSGGTGGHIDNDAGTPPPKVEFVANGLAARSIDNVARYESLAYRDGGLMSPGRNLKFLIDNRDKAAPAIYFMNSNFRDPDGSVPDAARYHHALAKRVLEDFDETLESFSDVTYETHDKQFVAGTIQTYFLGSDKRRVFGIQFWPEDIIREQGVVDAIRVVAKSLHLDGARVAFVATGVQQTATTVRDDLKSLGVDTMSLDDVLGSVDFIPLNRGEAWGYLRVFPADPDALSATDIPVFNELPLDLTVVAGTITRAYQDPTSHVNLKSKERNTPNMVLRSASPDQALLAQYADKPVHLVVDVEGFTLEPTTDEVIQSKLRAKLDKPWVSLPFDPSDELLSYGEMCPLDPAGCLKLSRRFGAKATSLGFLTNRRVLGRTSDPGSLSHEYGYDIVPKGFGVPFTFYRDFVDHPPNSALRSKLSELITGELRGGLSPLARRTLTREVQQLFYTAQFPAGMVERVHKRVEEELPGVKKIKVRSSANAEDMRGFDGAGLYSSFAANLKKKDLPDGSCRVEKDGVKLKMKPKTLGCAMKGVFASVWNKRAVEERSYARLDHETALMGIAIVAKYDLQSAIAANSVVVTRVMSSDNVFGYTFATQQGNALVTNPEKGTLAENTIAAFIVGRRKKASFAVTRYATPKAGAPRLSDTVLPEQRMRQMLAITRHAELEYCKANRSYYGFDCSYVPSDPKKPSALDFELKYLENGQFICKQMREFSGR